MIKRKDKRLIIEIPFPTIESALKAQRLLNKEGILKSEVTELIAKRLMSSCNKEWSGK